MIFVDDTTVFSANEFFIHVDITYNEEFNNWTIHTVGRHFDSFSKLFDCEVIVEDEPKRKRINDRIREELEKGVFDIWDYARILRNDYRG